MATVWCSLSTVSCRRSGLRLAVVSVAVSVASMVMTGVGRADSPTFPDAPTKKPSPADSPTENGEAAEPVAFQMASSGVFDPTTPTIPAPPVEAAPVARRVWRDARPKIPRATSSGSPSLATTSLSVVLEGDPENGDTMFSFYRSIAPLLTPPSLASDDLGVAVNALRDPSVGVGGSGKFRSSVRSRWD